MGLIGNNFNLLSRIFYYTFGQSIKSTTTHPNQLQPVFKNRNDWYIKEIIQGDFDHKFIARAIRSGDESNTYILKKINNKASAMSEFLVLSQTPIHNAFLLTPIEWIHHKDTHYFIYEHEDIDLFSILAEPIYEKFRKKDAILHYLMQILRAVEFLHAHLIIHYDLKFENMVFNMKTRKIRLIDFECCQSWDSPKQFLGTFHYMAPEIFLLRELKYYEPGMQDIWSIGILFLISLLNRSPISSSKPKLTDYLRFIESIPENTITSKCLKLHPSDRSDIYELINLMSEHLSKDSNIKPSCKLF